MSMANTARFTVKGIDGVVEVNFDIETWRGDVLLTLEEHLGGESLLAWARRWAESVTQGMRLSEFRISDIVGLVYLGCSQVDPDTTWLRVARAISPLTLDTVPDDVPVPPVSRRDTVHVDPDLGQQVSPPPPVPAPPLAPLERTLTEHPLGLPT